MTENNQFPNHFMNFIIRSDAIMIMLQLLLEVVVYSKFHLVNGILRGHDVSISDAPYQVNYGDICGGVLIHQLWALTAAHCGIEMTYVRVGSKYRLNGPKVAIARHLVHPKYGLHHTFDYDVQLLEVKRRLHFSDRVSMIRISEGDCGEDVVVTGWGYSVEKGDYKDILQRVRIPVVPIEECQEVDEIWYNHSLTSRMFCAGGDDGDACQGDSGGAAVSYGRLVGLSSFGFGCGRSVPGVYTNLSDARIIEWVQQYAPI